MGNMHERFGRTKLFGVRDPKEIQRLIDSGIDVNATDDFGDTAICHCSSVEEIKVLVKNGADVNLPKTKPIHKWLISTEAVHYLFEQGAFFNTRYSYNDLYDEYSDEDYDESSDPYRMQLALVFRGESTAVRISYAEAIARVGSEDKLKKLISDAHKEYLSTKKVVPFEVVNGKIFAYVLNQ